MYPNAILTLIFKGIIFLGDVSMTFHFHTFLTFPKGSLHQPRRCQDVPGELSPALGRLRCLELLDLGAAKLSGDLAVLRNATGLRTLNLSHSQDWMETW